MTTLNPLKSLNDTPEHEKVQTVPGESNLFYVKLDEEHDSGVSFSKKQGNNAAEVNYLLKPPLKRLNDTPEHEKVQTVPGESNLFYEKLDEEHDSGVSFSKKQGNNAAEVNYLLKPPLKRLNDTPEHEKVQTVPGESDLFYVKLDEEHDSGVSFSK
jgi:hypothetical protein